MEGMFLFCLYTMGLLYESCLRTMNPDQVVVWKQGWLFCWLFRGFFPVVCSCGGELREFYTEIWFSVACAPSFVNKLQVDCAQKLKELAVFSVRFLTCCRHLKVWRWLPKHLLQLLGTFLWVSEHTFKNDLSLWKDSVLEVSYSSRKSSLDTLQNLNFS